MSALVDLVAALLPLATVVAITGIVLLFKAKGRLGLALILFAAAVIVPAAALRPPSTTTQPTAHSPTSSPNAEAQKAGFPNLASFRDAQVAGIDSFEEWEKVRAAETAILLAARQAAPPQELRAYCTWLSEGYAVSQQANEKFGDEYSDAKWDWDQSRQRSLLANLESEIGLLHADIRSKADANFWDARCAAKQLQRVIVEQSATMELSRNSQQNAWEALNNFYVDRLFNYPDEFFQHDRYGAASCDKEDDAFEMKWVGCRLRDFGRSTDYDIFLVGELNGATVIVPFGAEALGRVEGIENLTLDDGSPISIGHYVGPILNWQTVRQQFDCISAPGCTN